MTPPRSEPPVAPSRSKRGDAAGARILIVEDEKDLADALAYNLREAGYAARAVASGASAIETLRGDPSPDLVLLDLVLPDVSGTEICQRIRQDERTRHVPVIIVTGRGDEIDRVVGFEVGADDYVVKPFSMRELLLRVRAVLRRRHSVDPEPRSGTAMEFGILRVDAERHRAWVNGAEVHLTPLEFRLIEVLLSRRGRVLTREFLLADIWGIADDSDSRTIDTHVRRLREALGPAAEYIETVRGIGYRFKELLNGRESRE